MCKIRILNWHLFRIQWQKLCLIFCLSNHHPVIWPYQASYRSLQSATSLPSGLLAQTFLMDELFFPAFYSSPFRSQLRSHLFQEAFFFLPSPPRLCQWPWLWTLQSPVFPTQPSSLCLAIICLPIRLWALGKQRLGVSSVSISSVLGTDQVLNEWVNKPMMTSYCSSYCCCITNYPQTYWHTTNLLGLQILWVRNSDKA